MVTAAAAASGTSAWLPVAGVVAGAAVSGVVAIVLALIQRKSLNDQAAAAAGQSRRDRRHDTRQEKYTDYLVAAEAFVAATVPLDELFAAWTRKYDGVSGAERERFDALLTRLQQCHGDAVRLAQLVRIAGPSAIADPVGRALRAMTRLRDAAGDGVVAVIDNVDPRDAAWSDGRRELRDAVEQFISQALVILDGEAAT